MSYKTTSKLRYKFFDISSILLILTSILILIVEAKLVTHFTKFKPVYETIELIIIFGFFVDYAFRVFVSKSKSKYIFSWAGIIDLIAFLPNILSLFLGFNFNSSILRSLRLVRLLKVLTVSKPIDSRIGVFTYLIPYLVTAIAFKGVVLVYESSDWWPQLENMNTILGVTGFAVAIAMGTKLSVVNGRIYAIEDSICRIIGCIRDIENKKGVQTHLVKWTIQLEETLKSPSTEKAQKASQMRLKTDELESELEKLNIGGPATASFHRDVAFLIHRMTAITPAAFDNFLKVMTFIYSCTLIFIVPGLTGLFSSVLVVLSLGGLFYINKDMDSPLDYSIGSLFDARLDALEQFNSCRLSSLSSHSENRF